MPSFAPPPGYDRIRVVPSFQELVTARFADGVNALCWPRSLPGNFGEIVGQLGAGEGVTALDEDRLNALALSDPGRTAREVLLEDLRLLRDHGLAPELNCVHGYPRDEDRGPVPTDVFSFHADSAPVEADTWLCTYHGAPSEGLRNDEAQRRVDVPATRAELLQSFGGKDDDIFREFLSEQCYDLHYAPIPDAQPFSFGLGNLWRIAVEYTGPGLPRHGSPGRRPVPPCIHRAPETVPGQPRLLLIS
jgi:hypothetical protein